MVRYLLPFRSQCWDLDKWQELGFKSREDAQYWQDSSCGVLCLAMVLERTNYTKISVSELIRKGCEIGAYSHEKGWSHQGLAKLARQYRVRANEINNITLEDLEQFLKDNNVVIASIKWAFVNNETWRDKVFFWKRVGGHLALVTGFDAVTGGFYVHHTSVQPEYNWQNKLIPREVFAGGFTNKGIVLQLRP